MHHHNDKENEHQNDKVTQCIRCGSLFVQSLAVIEVDVLHAHQSIFVKPFYVFEEYRDSSVDCLYDPGSKRVELRRRALNWHTHAECQGNRKLVFDSAQHVVVPLQFEAVLVAPQIVVILAG